MQSFNFKLHFHLSLLSLFMLSVRNARNLSKLSGNFAHYPETFQTVQKLSKLSGNFSDCPETFWTIQNFPDYSETFKSVRKTFQTFRKLSRQCGNFLTHSTVQASFNGQFCMYAQKLSGRAKTFRSAMQTRRRGFWDSGQFL